MKSLRVVWPVRVEVSPTARKASEGQAWLRDMLVAIRGKIADLKKLGKPLEEVIEARPRADYDSKWGQFVIDGKTFTSLVYKGV